jgi:hypothetical protein
MPKKVRNVAVSNRDSHAFSPARPPTDDSWFACQELPHGGWDDKELPHGPELASMRKLFADDEK